MGFTNTMGYLGRKIKSSIPIIGKWSWIMNFFKFWETLFSSKLKSRSWISWDVHMPDGSLAKRETSGVVFGSLHNPPSIIQLQDWTSNTHSGSWEAAWPDRTEPWFDGTFVHGWGFQSTNDKWVCWACWQRIWLGIQLSGWTTRG